MSNETTPLVSNGATRYDTANAPAATSSNGSGNGWKARLNKPSPWLLIPCAILYLFAGGLATPSQTFIYRLFACEYWWSTKGGHEVFNGGPSDPSVIPDSVCRHAEIEKLTSNLTTAISLLDATLTIFTLSVFSVLVSKWGRKISLLFCVGCMVVLLAGHAASVYIRGVVGFVVLVLSVILQSVASAPLLLLAFQLYVTDTVAAEKRAFFFSLLTGSQLGAVAVSTTVGGLLPKATGLFLSPFLLAIGVTILCWFYVAILVPESLTPERRAQLLESSGESIRSVNSLSNAPMISIDAPLHRRIAQRLNIFRPLAILLPSRKPGRRSWSLSLFIVAISLTLVDFGGTYSSIVMILTGTNRYHFGPAEVGLMLSMLTLLKAIFLLVLFPTLVVVGRKWYADRVARQLLGYSPPSGDPSTTSAPPNNEVEDDGNDSDDSSMIGGVSSPPSIAETIQANANLFDVFLASGSWFIDAVAFFFLAASSSVIGFLWPLALVCLGGGGRPAISAYVTEIVPPRHLDRALAALAMLQSLIIPLSMVTFGSLYTLTVDSVPGLSFGIMAMLVLAASGLVLILTRK